MLSHAHWLWLDHDDHAGQTTLLARRVVEVDSVPATAPLAISACHIYRLYVNGAVVGRGPDRADPRFPYFDEYDLAPWLRAGRNTLVCLLHHFNPRPAGKALNRMWPLYDGEPGFIAALNVSHRLVTTDEHWRMRQAPGWSRSAVPISRFLPFRHEVDLDAAAELQRALAPDYDDSGWSVPRVQSPGEQGRMPIPREQPALRPITRRCEHLHEVVSNEAEVVNRKWAMLDSPRLPLTVRTVGSEGAWLRFDFGRSMTGFTQLKFRSGGPGRIDLYHGEAGQRVLTDRLCFAAGQWNYTPLDWRGGQFVELHLRDLAADVVVESIVFDEMVYPFHERGSFRCADPTLTALWQICKTTVWSGTHDHPQDCAREQALWISDLPIYTRAAASCFGDLTPVAKSLAQVFRTMDDRGIVAEPSPCGIGYNRLGNPLPWSESPMFLASMLQDYILFTGDHAWATRFLPDLQRLLDRYQRYEDVRGLIQIAPPDQPALTPFGGWDLFQKDGIPCGSSSIYAINLQAAATVASWCGQPALAQTWSDRASRTVAALREHFWDPARCVFVDGEREGRRTESVSWAANAWAAKAGAVPSHLAGAWINALRQNTHVFSLCCPFDATNVLEALVKLDLDLHVRELLDRYFGSLVRHGVRTLPEMWWQGVGSGARFDADTSTSHFFGAGPAYVAHQYVLGVIAATPGWAQAHLRPRLMGLPWAEGQVPTPNGTIDVRWQQNDTSMQGRITLPIGTDAMLELPWLSWGDQVLTINGQEAATHERWPALEAKSRGTYQGTSPRIAKALLRGGESYDIELISR